MSQSLNTGTLASRPIWQRLRAAFGRGIGKGIAAGGLVKIVALAVQLVAMPLALDALGTARFGVLLMLMGLAQWITLGNFGMNTALARIVAGGEAENHLASYLGAALTLSLFASATLAFFCGAILRIWLQQGHGLQHIPQTEIVIATVPLFTLLIFKTILVTFQGVQIGQLNTHRVNIFQAIGQIAVMALLILVTFFWPHLIGFVLALVGGLLLGDLLNARDVLSRVRPAFGALSKQIASLRSMVSKSIAFTVINLVAFGSTGFLTFLVGAMTTPEDAVSFGLMMRLWAVLLGVLAIINLPLWPAMLDGLKSGHKNWVRRTVQRFLVIEAGIGLIAAFIVGIATPDIFRLWVGESFSISPFYCVLFGLVVFQGVLAYFWGIALVGLGRERVVAWTHAVRFSVLLGLGALVIPAYGGVGAMAVLAIAHFLAETVVLPVLALRILNGLKERRGR